MLAFVLCLLTSLLVQELVPCALTNQKARTLFLQPIRCETNTILVFFLLIAFFASSSDWPAALVMSVANGPVVTLELV